MAPRFCPTLLVITDIPCNKRCWVFFGGTTHFISVEVFWSNSNVAAEVGSPGEDDIEWYIPTVYNPSCLVHLYTLIPIFLFSDRHCPSHVANARLYLSTCPFLIRWYAFLVSSLIQWKKHRVVKSWHINFGLSSVNTYVGIPFNIIQWSIYTVTRGFAVVFAVSILLYALHSVENWAQWIGCDFVQVNVANRWPQILEFQCREELYLQFVLRPTAILGASNRLLYVVGNLKPYLEPHSVRCFIVRRVTS